MSAKSDGLTASVFLLATILVQINNCPAEQGSFRAASNLPHSLNAENQLKETVCLEKTGSLVEVAEV